MVPPIETARRRHWLAANFTEYGQSGDALNWVTDARAQRAEATRRKLLSEMGPALTLSHRQTKPHVGPLSPGCRACGDGAWSCLFINGICNCRCFYCPTPQAEISVPTTNQVPFDNAADYAAYVAHFQFEGASISGGEPLMTLDRTLSYIRMLRRRLGEGLHLWLYTNGVLLKAETVSRLADAGLDEIRFDISAADYTLKGVELAAGRIPVVTVEIPAIPEDGARLAAMLPAMKSAGVDHLNLHQLRLTPHNCAHLIKRPYTFLHGERVTVLESELSALRLLRDATQTRDGLPVNYCSFAYKYRFQRAAVRRRMAAMILNRHEGLTEKGYIRRLNLRSRAGDIGDAVGRFQTAGADPASWSLNADGAQVSFHHRLWPVLGRTAGEVSVSYAQAVLRPQISYRCSFHEVRVGRRKLYIEKQPVCPPIAIDGVAQRRLKRLLEGGTEMRPVDGESGRVYDYECIVPGLQDYY